MLALGDDTHAPRPRGLVEAPVGGAITADGGARRQPIDQALGLCQECTLVIHLNFFELLNNKQKSVFETLNQFVEAALAHVLVRRVRKKER